jgi:hypothetical protein
VLRPVLDVRHNLQPKRRLVRVMDGRFDMIELLDTKAEATHVVLMLSEPGSSASFTVKRFGTRSRRVP